MGGAKAEAAMGTVPRAGLSMPRSRVAAQDPMGNPEAYAQQLNALRAPRTPAPAPAAANADPIIGYDTASGMYLSGGQKFSGSNLSEIDAAMKAGYLDIDNTDKLPPGVARVRASQIKNYLQAEGVKRGFGSAASEVGSQIWQGVKDIPQMGVRAAQFAAPAGSAAEEFLKQTGDEFDTGQAQYNPDVYGRGEVASALIKGGRSLAPSVAAGAAMMAAPIVGTGVAGGLFFGSTASDTYERGLKAGLSQEDAKAAALKTGGIEALGESLGNVAGAKTILGAGKVLSAMAKGVQMGQGKRVAVDLLANAGVQAGTEFGQAYGQTAVEREAGITAEDPFGAGVEGAKVGLGMAALMAPFGVAAGYANRPKGALPQAEVPQAEVPPVAPAQEYAPVSEGPTSDMFGGRGEFAMYPPTPQMQSADPRVMDQPDIFAGTAIPMGYNPESTPITTAGQEWQGMTPSDMGPLSMVGLQGAPQGEVAPVSAGQAGAAWQGMPQSQPTLEGGYGSLEEQRAAAMVEQERIAAEQARKEDLAEQRIAAVSGAFGVESPLSPSEGVSSAVAPSVTPQEPQTPAEPFDRQKLARQTRSDIARTAQDMGIQITGKPTKAQILGMIDDKIAGKEPVAPVAPAKPAPTKGPKAPKATATVAKPAPTKGPKAPKATATVAKPFDESTPEAELAQAVEDAMASGAGMSMTNKALESAVQSLPGGKPKGRITIGRNIMAGIVRALRKPFNPDTNAPPTPLVYAEGTAKTDKDLTNKYATQMIGMRDAALKVAKAYDTLSNLGGNVLPSESKVPETAGSRTKVAGTKTAALQQAQQRLRNAVEELIAASGSAANANALVAAFKTRVQTEMAKKTIDTEKGAYWTSMDVNLSRAWKMFNDGQLEDTENLANLSTGEKRNAWEIQKKGAAEEPLVAAATEGAKRHKGGAKEKGILGVLSYLQSKGNTPYERMLASAIARALRGQTKVPKVVFDVAPGEHASYTPATDTIHLSKTASAEVTLHEALHAALQWLVYTQPNNPSVARLRQAVKDVVAYDRSKLKSPNAKAAYDIIAGLAKSDKPGDINAALLELVSYGMTMPDFVAALRQIPSTQDQKFVSLANKLYDMFAKLLQRFLGVSNTVANDVMDATARLLEESTANDRAKAFGKNVVKRGSTLNAAVTSSTPASNAAQPGQPQSLDLTQFTKKLIPNIITEHLFKAMGWTKLSGREVLNDKGELEMQEGSFSKAAAKVADYIKDKSPALSKYISYVNPTFGVPVPMREWFQTFKTDKHTSAIVTDALANKIASFDAPIVLEIIKYLDGDVKEIRVGDKAQVEAKELADMMLEHRARYIAALRSPKAKAFFRDLKFSESMVFATSADQVSSNALGARKLNELAAQKTLKSMSDNIYGPLDNMGKPTPGGRYKQLMQTDPVNPTKEPIPAGFVHESRWDSLPADTFPANDGLIWTFEGKAVEADTYVFTAYRDAKAAIDEGKADSVANALRNTMAILAASYASNNLTDAIASKSGDADSVVFDNVKQLNKALDITVLPNSILNLSDPEAKSPKLQGIYRSKHQWVQIPAKGDIEVEIDGKVVSVPVGTYGALQGKLVRSDVWAAVQDMTDRRPIHDISALHDTMRLFKKAKTIYNPGTHLTNIASNITLAMMHDIPMVTVGKATAMLFNYARNPDAMALEERRVMHAFMNSGAMLGDFSSIEVKRSLYEAYKASAATNEPTGVYDELRGWASTELAKRDKLAKWVKEGGKTDDRITAFYAAEDNAFRLAAFLSKAGEIATTKGKTYLTPAEFKKAGDYARFAFLDYDIDSKAVKVMRQSVLPFVSWSYAIMPVLGHIALHKPWKLVNVLLAYSILDAAMGGDEDDEVRKGGPEKFQSRLWGVGPHAYIRLPGLGDDQNPVYYKLGAYIPTGNWFDKQPQGFLGINNWPQPVSPGGPFTNAIIGLMGGVDPYTGKPLSAPTDSTWEEVGDRAKFMAQTFTPPWAPTAADVATKAMGGQGKPELGITGNPVGNLDAAQKFLGLQVHSFNTIEAGAVQAMAARGIKAEFDKELAKIKRAQNRYETPDWEAFYKRRDELLQRRDERIRDLKGE